MADYIHYERYSVGYSSDTFFFSDFDFKEKLKKGCTKDIYSNKINTFDDYRFARNWIEQQQVEVIYDKECVTILEPWLSCEIWFKDYKTGEAYFIAEKSKDYIFDIPKMEQWYKHKKE